MQPLANAEEHAVQVPPATLAHPASQPSVASSLVSNLLASHARAVQLLIKAEVHDEQIPPATVAQATSHSFPINPSLHSHPLSFLRHSGNPDAASVTVFSATHVNVSSQSSVVATTA